MTIGESQLGAAAPAPEPDATAAPGTENPTNPPAGDNAPEDNEDPKTFSQEDVDAAVTKRLGIERRKWERDQAAKAEQPRTPSAEPPKADQYKTVAEYLDAVGNWKADQIVAERDQKKQQQEVALTYAEREEKAREKYPDFQDVVFADNLQITQAMYDTIVAAENGPDVVYHLGKNPDEAARIAKLPPLAQARELGRIEASLAAKEPEGKKVSSAPAPITPVGGRAPTPKYDTTDPRSMETMSTSDWIKAENERRSKQNRR